jgi:phosphatidylserine/phosphatidylglycerophosphate/cardiolipin synthase-like enzyme
MMRLQVALGLALVLGACGKAPQLAGSVQQGVLTAQKTAHGGYKSGNRTLYVLPEAGPGFMHAAIAQARRSIKLEVYILTEQGVVDGLIAAKNRGVDVQVMVEPKPFNPGNPHAPLPVNHKAVNALRAGGVPVMDTNPAYTYTHAKFMSVDDATTFVSTANFTRTGLGTDPKGNREYVVEDHAPADVAEFVRVFQADQARQAYQPSNPESVISPVNARAQILGVIAAAKKEVLIADEVAGDPQVTATIQAATARGVRVRCLLEDFKPTASDPDPLNYQTARAWTAAGAQVRLMTKPTLHAKTIIADGRSMYVGSENLTTNSLDHNREIGLRLDDAALVAPVLKTTEADWANAHAAPGKKL